MRECGRRWRVAALAAIALVALARPAPALPPLPAGWPASLELGMTSPPGDAAALRAAAPFGARYQYLSGGVNTGGGWATWNTDGRFVTAYIEESAAAGILPVFSYYMLVQSAPGNAQGESAAVYTNLQTRATMSAYYADLALFFQRAGAFPGQPVVLHVEPDLWGYMQQRAPADDAAAIPAQVAATGRPELAGLPDDLTGFARAILRLRDLYAPNVRLGYHLSTWGTNTDIAYADPPDATVDALAARAAAFYLSLHADFDVAFGEFADRDAGFRQAVDGDGGAAWWDAGDFARHVRFLAAFTAAAHKRVVLWQIPLGNTRMRAVDNTWNHYQDNRVEWLLDDPGRTHLAAYAAAGVIGLLFGRGGDGATCACDAAGDGVTNPAPIDGNTGLSTSADDDGGFFRQKAAEYYAAGALALDGSAPGPPGGSGSPPGSGTSPGPASPGAGGLHPWAAANASVFHPGETLVVSLGVDNPGVAGSADFYLGVVLPDGRTVVSLVPGAPGVVLGSLTDPASLAPFVTGVPLRVPFAVSRPDAVVYTWSGGEPPGRYAVFLAAAAPGGLTLDRLRAVAAVEVTLLP